MIANPSQLAVTANIAEADAAKVQLGQAARITFPATNATGTGTVTQITPQSTVTNNVVQYPVQVSLATAPPGVGVGNTASLSITTGTKSGVLVAPTSAITTVGNRHTVVVRRGDQDVTVPVEIGIVGDTTTEIVGGVSTRATSSSCRPSPRRRTMGSPAARRGRWRRRMTQPVIELRAASKVYGSGDTVVRAVDRVDLVVERGDYVAVMGASGSGKSTLMNIIGCLDAPTSGRYLLDGVDVRGSTTAARPPSATARSGSSSSRSTSSRAPPRCSNVELPLAYAGVRSAERRRRARAASRGSGSPTARTTGRRSCRAGSSSASPSRGRS